METAAGEYMFKRHTSLVFAIEGSKSIIYIQRHFIRSFDTLVSVHNSGFEPLYA